MNPIQPASSQSASSREGVASSIYARIYHVLLAGMFVSTTLFAAGMLRAWMTGEAPPLSTEWIRDQYHWYTFFSGLRYLDPTSLLMAATLVLILTPILRVAVSIYAFAVEGDRKFVAITGTVLAIIICTVVLARLGLVSPEHVKVNHPRPAAVAGT